MPRSRPIFARCSIARPRARRSPGAPRITRRPSRRSWKSASPRSKDASTGGARAESRGHKGQSGDVTPPALRAKQIAIQGDPYDMLKTKFCELFGVELPIMLAGMGTVALADLAAAVSEAGGMGTVALAGFTPEGIHNEIAAARRLTKKPLACNVLIPLLQPGVAEAAAAAPVEAVTLFWGAPAEHVSRFKDAGKKVIWQCGSAEEAAAAKRAGADLIIAQGVEAGGHVRGLISTLPAGAPA